MNIYAVIMAGGSGKRFWPLGTKKKPKQYLNIIGKESLLQQAAARAGKIVSKNNIIVVTNKIQVPLLKKQLPWLSPANIIAEPQSKNTAPCIAAATRKIYGNDPKAVMIILPADHIIKNNRDFCRVVTSCVRYAVKKKVLVTIGIKPQGPHTGYGYIKMGDKLEKKIYRVARFTEKPNLKKAKEYYLSGKYRWNSGMFICRADTMLAEIKKFMPRLYRLLTNPGLAVLYRQTEDISIDYGIMEKTNKIVMREAEFFWDDVGTWDALAGHFKKDAAGNILRGNSILLNSKNSLIITDHWAAAGLGLDNMIVIAAENGVLVCRRDQAQQVKDIVALLDKKNAGRKTYPRS